MSVLKLQNVAPICGILLSYALLLAVVYSQLPDLLPEERVHLTFPWNLERAKNLGLLLSRYKGKHYFTVLAGLTSTFSVLQSFPIPGSAFIVVLFGYLFPVEIALPVVCLCSACGASVGFYMSSLVGRDLVQETFGDLIVTCRKGIQRHQKHLLGYIIFLRVLPIFPYWFINWASPVMDVPLWKFFLGTFIGIGPSRFMLIQTGKTLEEITSTGEMFSWNFIILILATASISIGSLVYNTYWNKEEEPKKKTEFTK
ncbi:hypothetical protein L596_019235 [Steinernema carpocapsae]|nr:hypothetical protein L596_019235 [Steinernema carpocapsae]